MGAVSLEAVCHEDFVREEGTTFALRDRPGTTLRLVEVSPAAAAGGWESFSLVFAGPREAPLEQGVHLLRHEALGELDLFLVPLAPDDDGPRYEAVFNRAAPETDGGA